MRKIKFRAWDKVNKKIHPVLEINFKYKEITIKRDSTNYFLSFNQIELMQFTGIKDCNEKEIFEGDICKIKVFFGDRWSYCNLPIIFKDGSFGYELYEGSNTYKFMPIVRDEKVIGNIFQNINLWEKNYD